MDLNMPTTYDAKPRITDDSTQSDPAFSKFNTLGHLSISRLERITRHLWLAGRPQISSSKKSPLHRLRATNFEFVLYEQADLHLLWGGGLIYIKPLPSFLLCHTFWESTLCDSGSGEWGEAEMDLFTSSVGLLLSYTWLIRWESDLTLAHAHGLVSKDINYIKWMAFRSSFVSTFSRDQLPIPWLSWRYDYAELRLNRINVIWRLTPKSLSDFIRGYQSPYRLYTSFFQKNFSLVIVIFIYVTVVLTAMQLGLTTTKLEGSEMFQNASVGFAVFCCILPVVVLGVAFILLVILILFNWFTTKRHLRSVRKQKTISIE
ncbi:hypothetical protein BJ875DRAFT_503705 [Amylocarpus encephaloides]|uniref:Uncharacterized protein n=1 Tax=Amylocarpus encephaloides TaxID=45428 RepID=A0A9P7YLZ3_9HELO|nr:hypothetical protein BJ875DRAFT_503705 [Amylocarpus encephaloides]